jgi:hypothetical protein
LRRAEAVSWLLDDNPNFTIDKQTLIADFEHANQLDIATIKKYGNKISTYASSGQKYSYRLIYADVLLTPRVYVELYYQSKQNCLPDFTELRQYFHENIDTMLRTCMLWAVAYSRLEVEQKTELLKKYYSADLYRSLFKIGEKYKMLDILKWLQTKASQRRTNIKKRIEFSSIPMTPEELLEQEEMMKDEEMMKNEEKAKLIELGDCPF